VTHGTWRDDVFHRQPDRIAFRGADPNGKDFRILFISKDDNMRLCIGIRDDPMDGQLNKLIGWFGVFHVLFGVA
jgi:hypothetical protein